MKAKVCSLGSTVLLALTSPASAGWVYYRDGSRYYQFAGPDFVTLALSLLLFGGVVFLIIFVINNSAKPPPRAKTADEYNADAVLLAAKRHHTEMMSELRKAEIEAARVDAIYKERGEIIAHDKKVRDLNARLDEKRSAS
jgi:hypothetical protein